MRSDASGGRQGVEVQLGRREGQNPQPNLHKEDPQQRRVQPRDPRGGLRAVLCVIEVNAEDHQGRNDEQPYRGLNPAIGGRLGVVKRLLEAPPW